jgi:hypothetical protein
MQNRIAFRIPRTFNFLRLRISQVWDDIPFFEFIVENNSTFKRISILSTVPIITRIFHFLLQRKFRIFQNCQKGISFIPLGVLSATIHDLFHSKHRREKFNLFRVHSWKRLNFLVFHLIYFSVNLSKFTRSTCETKKCSQPWEWRLVISIWRGLTVAETNFSIPQRGGPRDQNQLFHQDSNLRPMRQLSDCFPSALNQLTEEGGSVKAFFISVV